MIGLDNVRHIFIYPELTDMRLGIYGLRKKIIEAEGAIEMDSLYMFCSKSMNQIKVLEVGISSTWLYQNKLINGKFIWPEKGGKSEIGKEDLKLIIEGSALIKRIERLDGNISLF